MNRSVLLCSLLFTLFASAFSFAQTASANSGKITIVIEPVFNNQPLQLSGKYYITGHRDTLFIDTFKFYITQLQLSAKGGHIKSPDIHLVDANNTGSLTFSIGNMPGGRFTSLQFMVGIDSITNTLNTRMGDLDTTKGMYRHEDNSYIMAEMEGRLKIHKAPHHPFNFQIGGYMEPYNTARTISFNLPQPIDVANGKNIVITIKADAAAWFKEIDLSKTNEVLKPGKEANVIADNYAQMFSISDVKVE